jgi:ABC transporter substrate binding protein
MVIGGGLICYGPDIADQFRHAAGYVDRILKREKPADLPVQAPTRYELAINMKTAKALGLDVAPTLLARADGSDRIREFICCDCSQPVLALRGRGPVCPLSGNSGQTCSRGFDRIGRE